MTMNLGMTRPAGAAATLRVVLHECLRRGAPKLDRIIPSSAEPGDNLFLEGWNLAGPDLQVDFGPTSTWAVAISDRAAFCIMPHGAAGTVSVSRFGQRSNVLSMGGHGTDEPTRVLRVDPADGLRSVFRDAPVLVRLSRPVGPGSLCRQTFRIEDRHGPVAGFARLSPDARVLIWRGDELLEPGFEHTVLVCGLRDNRGREVTPHRSTFTPCTLTWSELQG
jgi:hypothetical protein